MSARRKPPPEQTELDFDAPPPEPELPAPLPPFEGRTYVHVFDYARLGHQLRAVFDCMRDGRWRTFEEISAATGITRDASISARLRDLRKEQFGGFEMTGRRRGEPSEGLWEYQVIVPPGVGPQQLGAP